MQTMPDVSPTKWHLAHVTWFFERFVLEAFDDNYQRLNDDYHFLFNSYYYTAGQMHARPKRGLLSRPTLAEVVAYRRHVDAAVGRLLSRRGDDAELRGRVTLGLNHEQQHQELLLTDIKHVFSCNPLQPAVNADLKLAGIRRAWRLRLQRWHNRHPASRREWRRLLFRQRDAAARRVAASASHRHPPGNQRGVP